MDDFYKTLQENTGFLEQLRNIGPPVRHPDWVKDKLAHYKAYPEPDSFYFIVDLRGNPLPHLTEITNAKKVMGYQDLHFEYFLRQIHPNYLNIYLKYGAAAYEANLAYAEETFSHHISYSSLVPLYSVKEQCHWWVKQLCFAYGFDANNHMVSHLNIYRLVARYEGFLPSKPNFTYNFKAKTEVEESIIAITRKKLIADLFKELSDRKQKILLAYWRLYQQHPSQFPKPEAVGILVGLKASSVQKYK
ncbi:MAG: hypothetical protein AAFP19_10775 [Bacteroidota bacterium]